jgi:hypothetical protein
MTRPGTALRAGTLRLAKGRFSTTSMPSLNTAVGSVALANNDSTGHALAINNTAVGAGALFNNTDGASNTAIGDFALASNTIGIQSVAVGVNALTNQTGAIAGNTAVGFDAADHATNGGNTVVGALAGGTSNGISTGADNVVVGAFSGEHIGAGGGNIYLGTSVDPGISENGIIRIGDSALPVGGTTSTCLIGGIFGSSVGANFQTVIINARGQLGTGVSSARYKKDIASMGKSSEAIYSLRPVTFHYKGDETNLPCFGLIAEEVAKVDPTLILLDKEGKPQTVRYEQVNAMLLNEFLKEHRTVQELKSIVAKQEANAVRQQKQIDALSAGLQKVSSQLELSKAAPQTALNNQ